MAANSWQTSLAPKQPGLRLAFAPDYARANLEGSSLGTRLEVDHVKVWQTVGKLRRRHGLVIRGEPREPGYRVEDWTWEARRVRSPMRQASELRASP